MPVAGEAEYPEDIRLRYRFLDLRRERLHENIMLRSQGHRLDAPADDRAGLHRIPDADPDRLEPRRRARLSGARAGVHPGKFYALPQAPQMFKQLLMVAGFDRYFQIAPCFRDEDARADRSPGEFYQLDFEMSFVTQDDVFAAIEPVLHGVFEEFADGTARSTSGRPFPRIPYREVDAQIRHRQARPAQPDPDRRRHRIISRARASACSPGSSRAATSSARSRRPAPPTRAANSSTT